MGHAWNEFIFQPFGGFTLVLLGTLLLFAEVLVRGRFIFGLIGVASLSLYFTVHIQEGLALWMGGLFLLGILLVVLDGKFIGDGTIGGIGLLLMLISLAIPSPTIFYGIAVVTAFIVGALGSFIFLKYFPRRQLWSKLTLNDTLSSEKGYNSVNEGYTSLVGVEGFAQTDFRPTGTIKIDGKLYSAVSEGKWIKKGAALEVYHVNGTRILVKEIKNNEEVR
jgi:membrane-bound ClpP family serine protease